MQKDVIIISLPFTEPKPMIAPILLSACLEQQGISAKGIDLSIRFTSEFIDKPYWSKMKNLLSFGVVSRDIIEQRMLVDMLAFIKKNLLEIKNQYNPKYLGLSIFTNESLNFCYFIIPYIKKYMPDVKIIVGGRGLELKCGIMDIENYKKFSKYGLADLIIVGDSETSLVDAIKNNKEGLIFSPQQKKEDIENIPIPKWDDYDLKVYDKFKFDKNRIDEDQSYIAITGSKGCVRKCTFCDVASFWPQYIYRDGERIADEIITAYKKTGIVNYEFTDNLINGSVSNYRKMNEKLAQEIPNKIKYRGYAIFRGKNQMSDYDFEIAAKAGCKEWWIGVESGSERIRNELKKKFSNDDIHHSVTNLHRLGIHQRFLMFVGYPTETEEDFQESLDLLHKYAHLNKDYMIRIYLTTTFMVLQNSPLVLNPLYKEKYGLRFNDKDNHFSRFFWTADCNPENTFPERVRRWKRFVETMEKLDYHFAPGTPHDRNKTVLEEVEKVYYEKYGN